MARKHPRYAPEFRRQMIELVRAGNVIRPVKAVRLAGVDSKIKTDKDDGSRTKDLQRVQQPMTSVKGAECANLSVCTTCMATCGSG
jgi:hypothetical protein